MNFLQNPNSKPTPIPKPKPKPKLKPKTRKRLKLRALQKTREARKRVAWKGAQCSPLNQNTGTGTCFSVKELEELKQVWNARHVNSPIRETDPTKIVQFFQQTFQNCPSERCWLKKMGGVSGSKFQQVFAPLAPKSWKRNPNEWLTDEDIRQVMYQYEKKYPCFKFIGPSPIDFDTRIDGKCVLEKLCKFNFPPNKTKIGMIFNTDPHDKSGEHWISLFVNLTKNIIYFFDSTGEPCPPQILTLIKRIQSLSPTPLVFKQNTKEHQFSSTECGMYSLYFIINMLRDKIDAEFLKTHELKDAYIEKFRSIYFDPQDG